MNGYTLDTNIITALVKQNADVIQRAQSALRAGYSIRPNAISYYEIKRGLLGAGMQNRLVQFDNFCLVHGVVMIDQNALDKAAGIYADLKRTGQLLEDADILTAAIAIVNDLTLVTNNIQHFARITELRIENWMSV